MKYYYLFPIVACLAVMGRAQEKAPSPIHLTKAHLEALQPAKSDKEASQAADTEKPQEAEKAGYVINFNPVMHFDGQDDRMALSRQTGDLSKVSVFTVYRSEDKLVERPIWVVYGERSYIKLTTKKVAHSGRESQYEGGNTNLPVLSSYTHYYRPEGTSTQQQRIVLGGSPDEGATSFKGDIAEIIIYNKVLRGQALEKTESALALKYGITLASGKNYIDSGAGVIWNTQEHGTFTHRVAGIGRDDASGLYQKQSHSSADPDFLVIGAGQIARSNAENTTVLENRSFLVWGDNNQPLGLETEIQTQHRIALLQRQWRIQLSGDTPIDTQVQLNVSGLFAPSENPADYLLVIDQSGTGEFLGENLRYVRGDALKNGIVSFTGVQWDKDGSGSDVFSFSRYYELSMQLNAAAPGNCDALHNGVLQYNVSGGIPPYTYELSGENSGYRQQWQSTEARYPDNRIENLAGSNYEFTVTDAMGNEVTAIYTLENPVPITVDLGSDRRLSPDQPLYLDASFGHPEGTTYRWTSDSGFSSEQGSIYIDTPGSYQLTATSPLGCTATDEIVVSDRFIESFSLYPNQSEDGHYSLRVFLEKKADVVVHVFDMTGRLLDTMEGKNQMSYDFSGHIASGAGVYTVVLETDGERASRKLIIE